MTFDRHRRDTLGHEIEISESPSRPEIETEWEVMWLPGQNILPNGGEFVFSRAHAS
jgi:hypothetical protein